MADCSGEETSVQPRDDQGTKETINAKQTQKVPIYTSGCRIANFHTNHFVEEKEQVILVIFYRAMIS